MEQSVKKTKLQTIRNGYDLNKPTRDNDAGCAMEEAKENSEDQSQGVDSHPVAYNCKGSVGINEYAKSDKSQEAENDN